MASTSRRCGGATCVARSAWSSRTPGCSAGRSATTSPTARHGATDEQIIEAARISYVDRFVHSLPDGYDTVVDDQGSNLSAGERQLVTIARAFLADPAILILDEATSSVDTRTEVLVQHAMAALRADRTSFVIAHRLSTIRDADTILVMEDGRIVEQGDHDDLLERRGAVPPAVQRPVRRSARRRAGAGRRHHLLTSRSAGRADSGRDVCQMRHEPARSEDPGCGARQRPAPKNSLTRSVGRPMNARSAVTISGRSISEGCLVSTSMTPSGVATSAAVTPSSSHRSRRTSRAGSSSSLATIARSSSAEGGVSRYLTMSTVNSLAGAVGDLQCLPRLRAAGVVVQRHVGHGRHSTRRVNGSTLTPLLYGHGHRHLPGSAHTGSNSCLRSAGAPSTSRRLLDRRPAHRRRLRRCRPGGHHRGDASTAAAPGDRPRARQRPPRPRRRRRRRHRLARRRHRSPRAARRGCRRGRHPAHFVVAAVRPGYDALPGDGDRWLELCEIAETHGCELVEWFILSDDVAWCPRDLLAEPPRWP